MSNQFGIVDNNRQYQVGEEAYVVDENHIYRQAEKIYLNVDGVYRLVYAPARLITIDEDQLGDAKIVLSPNPAVSGETVTAQIVNADTVNYTYSLVAHFAGDSELKIIFEKQDSNLSGTFVMPDRDVKVYGLNYCKHINMQVTDQKVPNCKETGYKTYTCSVCGYSYTEQLPINPDGHDLQLEEVPSTCCTHGYMKWTCSICGYTASTELDLDPNNHGSYYESARQEPTCTEQGSITYTCGCGQDSYTVDGDPPLGHDWSNNDGVCAREGCGETCEHPEWSNGVCTICGYKCPHDDYGPGEGYYTYWIGEDASGHYRVCQNCGYVDAGHSHDEAQLVDNHDGTHTVKCSVCGYVHRTESCTYTSNQEYGADSGGHACACGSYEEHDWADRGDSDYHYCSVETCNARGEHVWTPEDEKHEICEFCNAIREISID
jgi:rubredoxin